MSTDNTPHNATGGKAPDSSQGRQNATRRIFAIPAPLKRIFDQFPLVTYPENALPVTSSCIRQGHALYVFSNLHDVQLGLPSFNPTCLKWQAYLKLRGLSFHTVPSNNHASPSGSLPFLIPASPRDESAKPGEAISSKKFKKWLASQNNVYKESVVEDARVEAYTSLLDQRIRNAWLFQLYINPANKPLMERLYIDNTSSSFFVRSVTAVQLRQAAENELIKASASHCIDEREIMRGAEEAFEALAALLGDDEWFFGQRHPSLFDSSVFAYTHLLTSTAMRWQQNPLGNILQRFASLVQHEARIMQRWGSQ